MPSRSRRRSSPAASLVNAVRPLLEIGTVRALSGRRPSSGAVFVLGAHWNPRWLVDVQEVPANRPQILLTVLTASGHIIDDESPDPCARRICGFRTQAEEKRWLIPKLSTRRIPDASTHGRCVALKKAPDKYLRNHAACPWDLAEVATPALPTHVHAAWER